MRKDALVRSTIDVRKLGAGHAGSPLMNLAWPREGLGIVEDWEYVKKPMVDEIVTASTVLQDDNDLFFPLTSNSIYRFVMNLLVEYSNTSGGFKYVINTSTSSVDIQFSNSNNLYGDWYEWVISGIITTTTADNFQLQWAQKIAAGHTHLKFTSHITYIRMRQT